jgi:hypothetical protein
MHVKNTAFVLRSVLTSLFLTLLISTVIFILPVNTELSAIWNNTLINGEGNAVIETSDGGYAIAGQVSEKIALIKTDVTGNLEWFKTYGEANRYHEALSIIQTNDGGYALGCSSNVDFNFLKTDSIGNIEWSKGFFWTSPSDYDVDFDSVIQTKDGGYFLSGGTGYSGLVVKTDEKGNMQWNKTLSSHVQCSLEAVNDGYLLGGWELIKIDSLGNVVWNKSTPNSFESMIKTGDGKYVIVANQPVRLVKIDLQGNVEWSTSYETGDYDKYYYFRSGTSSFDGGYILAGTTATDLWLPFFSGYIVKTDSNGKLEWKIEYSEDNAINSIIPSQNGGYVFTGVTTSDSTGDECVWFVKIEENPTIPAEPTNSPEPKDLTPPTIKILSPENRTYELSEVVLNFTVNELVSNMSYSLDGQSNVTILGNTTLSELSAGFHMLIVYAQDTAGNVGDSKILSFTMSEDQQPDPEIEPFPTVLVVAVLVTVLAIVVIGLLFYFNKRKH